MLNLLSQTEQLQNPADESGGHGQEGGSSFVADFWEKLEGLMPTTEVFAFAAICFIAGMLVVFLDWLAFSTNKKSILGFAYPDISTVLRLIIFWGLGAGVGGLLGASAKIFVPSLQAAILVGASWPIVLPKLIKAGEEQEPEQQ